MLRRFSATETLDADNKWKCPRCKQAVCAKKRMTIRRPPAILNLQLKRFAFGAGGGGGGFDMLGGFGGGGGGKHGMVSGAHADREGRGLACRLAAQGCPCRVMPAPRATRNPMPVLLLPSHLRLPPTTGRCAP